MTDESTAIGPRRIEDLWRRLTSGSFASTALELLGVALMTNSLRLIYLPAAWLFLGLMCFAASYTVEAARVAQRRSASDPTPTFFDADEDMSGAIDDAPAA